MFSRKKEKSNVTAELLFLWLHHFSHRDEVKKVISTGRIANEAQHLVNFGDIRITQIATNVFEFRISTNGHNGFTEFKSTYGINEGGDK